MSLELSATKPASPVQSVTPVRAPTPDRSAADANARATGVRQENALQQQHQQQRSTFARLLRSQQAAPADASAPAHAGRRVGPSAQADAPPDATDLDAERATNTSAEEDADPAAGPPSAEASPPLAQSTPAWSAAHGGWAAGAAASQVRLQNARANDSTRGPMAWGGGHHNGAAGSERGEAVDDTGANAPSASAAGTSAGMGGWAASLDAAMAASALSSTASKPVADATADVGTEGSLPSLGAVSPQVGSPVADPATPAALPATRGELPVAPESPLFPAALGVQLSTWLDQGVSHATLDLHPAELGPIEVRIAMSDGRAQIDLGSDVASTRAALADAMPQLTRQLGDVGLELIGSQVGERSGAQPDASLAGQGSGANSQQGRSADPGRAFDGRSQAGALPVGVRSAVPLGMSTHSLLDLYA